MVPDRLLASFSGPTDDPYLQGAGYYEIGRGRGTVTIGGHPVAPLMGELKFSDGMTGGMSFNPLSFLISFPDYIVFATFVPRSTLETDIEMVWLVSGSAVAGVDYDTDTVSRLWSITTEEDRIIIGDNQKGISSSGYRPGPYSLDESKVIEILDWYMKYFVDIDQ